MNFRCRPASESCQPADFSQRAGGGGAPADACPAPVPAASRRARGCRSGSWRYLHGPASIARCAGRRRPRAGGWRRHGAARAATRARRSMPAASAVSFRSCAKRWRVRWPVRPRDGNRKRDVSPSPRKPARMCSHDAIATRAGSLKRHHPFLVALAADDQDRRIALDGRERQGDQLRHAQAGAVEDLQQRRHAPAVRGIAGARRVDQTVDLGARQHLGQRPPEPRRIERARRIVIAQPLGAQEAEELAHHRQPARHRARRHADIVERLQIGAQRLGVGRRPAPACDARGRSAGSGDRSDRRSRCSWMRRARPQAFR